MNGIYIMTQSKLNKYFTEIYEDLISYTSKAINYFNKKYEANDLVSESYIYVLNIIDDIEDKPTLISYCKNFIKMQIKYTNSPYNLKNKNNNCDLDIIINTHVIEQDRLDESLIEEIQEAFILNLSSYEKRLYNIYFILDLKKGREIAEHLNISMSGSYNVINECKALKNKFNEFIKKYIL